MQWSWWFSEHSSLLGITKIITSSRTLRKVVSTSETSRTRTGGRPPNAPANSILISLGALGTVALVICDQQACISGISGT